MEQNQNFPSLGLGIDQLSKDHLMEASRWAKFLAIVGFVVCALVFIAGIFAGSFFSTLSDRLGSEYKGMLDVGSIFSTFLAIIYIGIAILYFIPCLFLFRFANYIKVAFTSGEQIDLNKSFQNLKKMFRFMGILTIIVLCFYLLIFLIGIAGVASMGF